MAGVLVGFTPQGVANPRLEPLVSESAANYKNLWPKVDMGEQVTSETVGEDLVLTGPGAPDRFTFSIAGATAEPDSSGGLDLVAGAKTVGVVPALTVTTAARHKPASAKLVPGIGLSPSVTAASAARFVVSGGQVTLSLSPAWLASLPRSMYPVVIDPSFMPVNGQVNPTLLETCSNQGGCDQGEALVGEDPSGEVWDSAVYIPFPEPPAVTPGEQQWEPTQAIFSANCSVSCEIEDDFVYGDTSEPSSFNAVGGGEELYQGIGDPNYSVYITPWIAAHESGWWFGFGGFGYASSNGTLTQTVLQFSASNVYVGFVYYQEPASPTLVTPATGSVLATTTPTLTSNIPDSMLCNSTSQPPAATLGGGEQYCDQPGLAYSPTYDFTISTSPTWGLGQVVADSGWIPQPYTTGTTAGQYGYPYTYTDPTWTVPPGALSDGMTYYIFVQDADTPQNPLYPELNDQAFVPAAEPLPAASVTVKLRLGAGGPSPTDTVGSPPGQTSVPSQGAPSPGLSPSSETVNMVTGDLALAVGTPAMTTLAGPAQVSLSYDSLQSSTATGPDYGLTASYYPDSGNHEFPPAGTTPLGTVEEPDIDSDGAVGDTNTPPIGSLNDGQPFLARWTGTITLPSGNWELGGISGGGMQVYLDGSSTAVFNDWSGGAGGPAPAFGSAQLTGGAYQIEVDDWDPGDDIFQLWADNVTYPQNPVPAIVTSPWLTPEPTGLPPGWSLGTTGPAWTSATDLGTQIVLHSPAGATATFTSNGNGSWTPQPGDTDDLTVNSGQIQLTTSSGYLYTYNSSGQLASMTTIADDRHPDALQYTYGPASTAAGAPVVLQSITDPVSGRSITLSYGSSTACTAPNTADLLCGISYWDGSSTSFIYNNSDQLAEVANPGIPEVRQNTLLSRGTPNATSFGYDSDGRLDDIRDALANAVLNDVVSGWPTCSSSTPDTCPLDTWITYNSSGQVATVTQPEPEPGAARPERSYTYYPSATTPGAGATAVTIAGFSPAGTPAGSPCTQPAPGCSPAGVASSVSYDSQQRIISQTSSTGLTSYTVWDTQDRPIITVNTAGEQTSTVYDINSDVTDTYGPAPTACFDPTTIPSGVSVSGPVAGYLPLADAATASGCGVSVPHTQTAYDQDMPGLGNTYWANGLNAGAAALHGTGNGSSSYQPGTSPTTCTGWALQVGTTSAQDLCATWPAGTTPELEGTTLATDANDQWSLQMSGAITLPSSGDWIFCVADNQNFTMDIDGNLVLTNINYELGDGDINNDFQGTYAGTVANNCEDALLTAGQHTIQISLVGSPAQTTSYNVGYVPPGSTGDQQGLPLSWLDPSYGLKTAVTDPDGNVTSYSYSDSADGIGPEFGLVTSTTQDPGGLALTTTDTYEDPADGGYLRKTASILPAGNQTSYQYYSGTGGPVVAACGVSASTPQGGQLEQQTDPSPGSSGLARVQQFIYDADGRQVGVRTGDTSDISGQLWQCTSYDPIGRITQQTWPATSTAPARTVTYSYSLGSSLAQNPLDSSVSDASGTISTAVDLLGRLVSYTDAWQQTTTISYNQAGQTTAASGPGGSAQLGYDPNSGQPTTTTVNNTLLATASYDSSGRLSTVAYGNNTQATIGYDSYGNQDSLAYTNIGSGQPITSDAVTYSPGGRQATDTASQPGGTLLSVSYCYDGAGRLTGVTSTNCTTPSIDSYSYATNPASDGCADPGEGANTNRTSVTTPAGTTDYCYNTADQLVSSITTPTGGNATASTSYAYSEDGDQTDDNGTTYTWDASDRVATATTPSGQTITSTYDAVNRLIQSASSTGSTVRYSYAGYTDAPAAVLDTSNNILQQLVALPGGVTVTLQASGNTWSYTNLQGDTTATASQAGTLTAGPVTYDPWGNLNPGQTAPANTTGPSTLGAYTTSGKLTSTATGTILLGARTFNPTEARFLSVDPVNGGCANVYAYAFGDPLDHGDLTGQASCQDAANHFSVGCSGSASFLEVSFSCTLSIGPEFASRISSLDSTLVLTLIAVTICGAIGLPGGLVAAVAALACGFGAALNTWQFDQWMSKAAQGNDYANITISASMGVFGLHFNAKSTFTPAPPDTC
jgi:RHS repeat-associated protein